MLAGRRTIAVTTVAFAAAFTLAHASAGAAATPTKRSTSIAVKRSSPATLTFDPTCAPGRRAVIAAAGDLLFHDALQQQALRPGQSFRAFWAPVASVLADADLTYGNLESPIAAGVRAGGYAHRDPGRVLDRIVYGRRSTELVFNTHPSVAADLAASGFDVVSTANNHSADRGVLGMDRTLDSLASAGLAHTGVRRSAEAGADMPGRWATRTTTGNGLDIAWLACTYGLNGMRDPKNQVLHCHRDRDVVLDELRTLAADRTVDATIFTPHWGSEGAPTPSRPERELGRAALEAGASAVIGAHPHVLQPWEKHTTTDGREGLIIYSTGNFISNQKSDDQRTGMIALLEVTRPDDGAPARLSAAGYIPTFVQMTGDTGHRVTEFTGTNAATQRLPSGNRIALSAYRDLPRACTRQPLVAMITDPPKSIPLQEVRDQPPAERPPPLLWGRVGVGGIPEAVAFKTDPAAPLAAHAQFALTKPEVPAHVSHLPDPPPPPPPTKSDPLRAARLRPDLLAESSISDLVAARHVWHVPPRPKSRPEVSWIAPPTAPNVSRLRPSPSPLASSCSSLRRRTSRKASRFMRTRSNPSSTSRRR